MPSLFSRAALAAAFAYAFLSHAEEATDVPAAATPDAGVTSSMETVVTSRRPYTAASSSTVRAQDFATRPITDPSDILEVTPGLLTVQHAGGGKATQYFIRGFDADHGTDLALSVDGVPVNAVSHGHGQGYADLHFVIPELIESFQVTKGPYAADQTDFATAGAVNLVSRRVFDRSEAKLGYGAFNTFRALLIAAPPSDGRLDSYVAAELYGSNGPFRVPERTRRLNLAARATLHTGERSDLSLQLQSYTAGWNASGQIPLRAVTAGLMDRFDSVDPTEGGGSSRHAATLQYQQRDDGGGTLKLLAYGVRSDLDLFSNFTFFAADPLLGDQIEQVDGRLMLGGEARYARPFRLGGVRTQLSGGARVRGDGVDTGLFRSVRRERLGSTIDARVLETSAGLWTEADVEWAGWLRTVAGVRADRFTFQVDDRLAAAGGKASALLVSPKASAVLSPLPWLDVYLNLGRGFHSNDARGVVRAVDPVSPLAAATGYELGARAQLGGLDLAAAAWGLDLDSEVVWVGDEGTTEPRPATRRLGVEVEARYRFNRWLRADVDVTWTRARFLEETGGGTFVPLAPVFTWSGGLSAQHPSGWFGTARVEGLTDRPANEDGSLTAEGFTLVDVEAGYESRSFRATLGVRNLFNVPWRQAQFANESRLSWEEDAVADLHFTPGYPLSAMASVSLFF